MLAPIALLCLWSGGRVWEALVTLVAVGVAWEWVELGRSRPLAWPGVLVPGAVVLSGAAVAAGRGSLALLLLGAGMLGAWLASGSRFLALGLLYVGVGALTLMWLRGDDGAGRANVLFLVLLVWASDIGAYIAGRLIGGPKLAPAISPSKTWAGAVGGLLAAALVGALVAVALGGVAPGRAALVAAGFGVASQAGDLLESWIKRRLGVKDSGRLIPGHGGLLDRLDGLLAAAAVAALLGIISGRGHLLWT